MCLLSTNQYPARGNIFAISQKNPNLLFVSGDTQTLNKNCQKQGARGRMSSFIVNQGPQDPKSAFTSEIWENSPNASEDSSHGRRISARLVQRSPERKPETHELHSPYRAIGTHVCPRSVRDPWRPSFSLFLFFFDFFDFFQQKFHVFEFF